MFERWLISLAEDRRLPWVIFGFAVALMVFAVLMGRALAEYPPNCGFANWPQADDLKALNDLNKMRRRTTGLRASKRSRIAGTPALRCELGIYGGVCGRNSLSVSYQGAGVKVLASRGPHNTVTDAPAFKGAATIATARQAYGIRNPDDKQLALF